MFRVWCVVWIVLGALAGCSRVPEPVAPQRPVVTFLHYFTDSLSGGVDDMARVFNANNPRYELKAVALDHESFDASMQDTLQHGHPPDLYSYWAGERTAAVLADLEPIDDVWKQAKLDERFSASLIRAASVYRGKTYFLPLTQHVVGFFYSKKVFAAYGVQPPKTWEEFLAVCERLRSGGVTPIALGAKDRWPAQFWFDFLLLRTVPYEFRERLMAGSASYDDPKVHAVFARWAELIEKGYFNAAPNDAAWDKDANAMVHDGKAAMTLMGTWNLGHLAQKPYEWVPGKDYGFFPFPMIVPEIPAVALGPIDGIVIPKKAQNLPGAKEALVFLAGVEAQRAFSQGSGALAPNLDIPRSVYNEVQQHALDEIGRSPYFAFPYDLSTPPALAELGLNAFSEFLAYPKAYPTLLRQLARDVHAHTQR